MMKDDLFDIVAIGGGTAGLVTAAGAAGLGARTALIERDRLGGDCLWTGCVPSKSLIGSARIAHAFRSAPEFGIDAADPHVDGAAVLESVRRVRGIVAHHDDPQRFRDMGVDVIEGEARFISPHAVAVGERVVRGRRFVIATGSRATVPPIQGLEDAGYFTHETAFERTTLPESVAIVGAGAIGVEFAQAYRRLGIEVTLVEMGPQILPTEEPELAEELQRILEEAGVTVVTGHTVASVTRSNGAARLTLDGDGTSRETDAAEILVAAGRRPDTDGLGLEEIGVKTERGRVLVDDKLRSSLPHIFAAGDVRGELQFTHVAEQDARVVIQNALFPVRTRADYSVVPWCIFTEPELAHVGLTEAEARTRHGDSVTTAVYDIADLDRAITDREARGRVKLVLDGGKILGGHILASSAGTMISEVALAMKHGIGAGEISALIHPYPTMGEGVRRAADAYRRSQLSGWKKKAVDLAMRVARHLPA